jgi:CRP-like cAMP-binding protein
VSVLPERGLGQKSVPRDLSATRRASNAWGPQQAEPGRPTLSELDRAMADIFRDLAKEETELLVSRGRSVVCHSGQLAVRTGDRGGEIFVVLEGSLMEMARQKGTASDTLAVYLRGDVIGEVPFAAAGVRKRSVIAMEETRLLGLTFKMLDDLVLTTPRLAAKVFRNLAGIVATRFQHETEFSGKALVSASVPLLRLIAH